MGRAVIGQDPTVAHVSASDLLKVDHAQTGEELRTAQRELLVSNQSVLASTLMAWPFPSGTRHVLLDAHSVIDNDKVLVDIPIDAIASLSPNRLIFLFDEPANIVSRRLSDTRQRPSRTAEELDAHQKRSLEVCELYSERMAIPLIAVQSGDTNTFRTALGL